ncbi:MAG: pyruvate kinase [Saprospiraceae bacterium]
MSAKPIKKKGNKIELKLRAMIAQIEAIIREAQALEKASKALLATIHPKYQVSARNLLHYQVLRRNDLSELQKKLGDMGLSRLAKAQSHVMASLKSNRAILKSILTHSHVKNAVGELSFKKGNRLLTENAKNLLGDRTKGRRTQIMVTMPSEAATDYQMVYDMMEAGMNCARVNCAHDDPHVWKKIIDHVRKAAKAFGKDCKVAMDLAGPKIRTGELGPGPKVLKIRPPKDAWGNIRQPLEVWLGPIPHPAYPHIPITKEQLDQLKGQTALYFKDTRGKKRKLKLIQQQAEGTLAECPRTTFIETGLPMYFHKDYAGMAIPVGELPSQEIPLVLKIGDQLRLDKQPIMGQPAQYAEDGTLMEVAHISCRAPEIFSEVASGQRILFDDGKIEGRIISVTKDHLMIEIVHAAEGGAKLRAEKGINLPDSKLTISGLTEKDKKDLSFVAVHADVVNFSFVNRQEDVVELFDCLRELKAKEDLGVILKIETQSGFNHLPEILFKAMKVYPVGVMIARGDLAIESGWSNIGRVQEEILSLCQAAHVTDIWATQVLESLAKSGLPSRAEITDAVMAQRADCVMLNKGPYILQAIRLLDTILKDMEPYWEKNAPLLPALSRASR